ncbi:MAG: hypothetical protein A3G91_04455 [Omnitrophica WOR_2 bacterium RIFCSPLOWO2_12_FULL_50_9]|nr:MAG: hypothetical protein A3D87_03705 [Omnitrophica WOR_2 bacterium RIFCSPHIGHO2_02_FULL_50_17]OGX40810.1 MAG: hypothetical protein A3G91_04455 [Omnitrophica WOR_2 bacterium RIFCSPLOWO2_12_FULL_50_9]
MITVQNVFKYFGRIPALKDISFEIGRGEIVGFLGKNAAGKTTLMRILTSYLPATSGRVFVGGKDVDKNSLAIRRYIGYLPETPPLYPNMTVREYLKFAAQLKDVPVKHMRSRIDRVLDDCRLLYVQNKPIAHLSKGYKQRIGIAQAIINEPELLILDEPTSGLDPVQIQQVRRLIKDIESKRTVLVSTHILSEIEHLAQRVLIINRGEIIKDESLKGLLAQGGAPPKIRVRFKGERDRVARMMTSLSFSGQAPISCDGETHVLEMEMGEGVTPNDLISPLLAAGIQVLEVKEHPLSLEDVFLRLNPPQPERADE